MLPRHLLKQSHKYRWMICITAIILGFYIPISDAQEIKPVAEGLAKKHGCLGCHASTKKIIGPAFRDISEKYRNTPNSQNYLMLRVKNGGSGIWGVVAMPANKNMSDADLESIIQWVLNH
jgi:cytochrome c